MDMSYLCQSHLLHNKFIVFVVGFANRICVYSTPAQVKRVRRSAAKTSKSAAETGAEVKNQRDIPVKIAPKPVTRWKQNVYRLEQYDYFKMAMCKPKLFIHKLFIQYKHVIE